MAQYQDLGVLGDAVSAMKGQGLDDATNKAVEEAERHGRSGSLLGSWLVKLAIALLDPSGRARVRALCAAPSGHPTRTRSPNAGYAPCDRSTDRLLILNERHLGRVLVRYVRHYDGHRPHRTLGLRPPDPHTARIPSTPAGLASICRREILGALINEYHAA